MQMQREAINWLLGIPLDWIESGARESMWTLANGKVSERVIADQRENRYSSFSARGIYDLTDINKSTDLSEFFFLRGLGSPSKTSAHPIKRLTKWNRKWCAIISWTLSTWAQPLIGFNPKKEPADYFEMNSSILFGEHFNYMGILQVIKFEWLALLA